MAKSFTQQPAVRRQLRRRLSSTVVFSTIVIGTPTAHLVPTITTNTMKATVNERRNRVSIHPTLCRKCRGLVLEDEDGKSHRNECHQNGPNDGRQNTERSQHVEEELGAL